MIWAWMDRSHRVVRARTFAPDWGIPEAEGNGSGSMKLAAVLGKSVTIIHGAGSLIYAKPSPNNRAELGGRITEAGELQATVAVSP
jgi:predicted PhzF superfamily epimerase YddE/YHI9